MAAMPKSLSRHGISGLVLAACVSMSLLLIGIGAFAISRAAVLHDKLADVTSRDLMPLAQMRLAQNTIYDATISGLAVPGDAESTAAAADTENIQSQVVPLLKTMVESTPVELRADAAALIDGWDAFVAADKASQENVTESSAFDLKQAATNAYDTLLADFNAQAERLLADTDTQKTSVDDAYSTLTLTTIIAVGIGVLFAIGLGWLIARSIRSRAMAVVAATDRLAAGDFTQRIDVNSEDELGRMALALNTACATLQSTITSLAGNAETLRASSAHMDEVNQDLATSSSETGSRADIVSATAMAVSANVQTVAAGSEQMMASVAEISRNASEAATVARSAVEVAGTASAVIGRLGESSTQITSVVKLITSIAEQTNLLALNATIEASRAGDAGKGFAVVANEVKELARETAKATDEISRQIHGVQADAQRAAETIGQISEVIGQISNFTTSIATAVEEQTATTFEIARNITEAATGAGEIAAGMTDMTSALASTGGLVSQSRVAASELASMSNDLNQLVGTFRYR